MKPLTEEQKQMVANNIKLVYKWYSKHLPRFRRYQDEVLSALHIALIRTAQRWKPELGTFGTLAYINFYGALRDVERSNGAQKNQVKSLEFFGDNGGYSVRSFGRFTRIDDTCEEVRRKNLQFSIEDCMSCLTPKEKVVLDLRIQGWANAEIGRHFEPPIHRERVRQIVGQIGEKLKALGESI